MIHRSLVTDSANGAAGDDMVSDCAGCVESGTNRARLCGLALAGRCG